MADQENSDSNKLYHLIQIDLWKKCKDDNLEYFPPTYEQDGFTHLTKDPNFLIEVGNNFYKATKGDWLLLLVDCSKTNADLKFEKAVKTKKCVSAFAF